MKGLFKYASGLFLAGVLFILGAGDASAQHRGGGGISGGASHFGGGSVARSGGINSIGARGSTVNRSNFFANRGATARGSFVTRGGGHTYNPGGFYRSGFGYYSYPHLGFYLNVLPYGYYPFYWGDNLFYYSGGIFYRPYDGGGYEVTTPPVGAAIPTLPDAARPIMIDGQQFYESEGVYYKMVVNDQGKKMYEVAGRDGVLNTNSTDINSGVSSAPQVGDIVNELPEGCRKVSLNGKKYYVSPNGIYYQAYVDDNGDTGYRIAIIPTDEQDN